MMKALPNKYCSSHHKATRETKEHVEKRCGGRSVDSRRQVAFVPPAASAGITMACKWCMRQGLSARGPQFHSNNFYTYAIYQK